MNKENDAQYQEAFDYLLAEDHELVIYGALKRLHVTKGNPLYDDLVQEGRMAFIQKYCKAVELKKNPDDYLVFIYQGVYWTLINYMNKQRVLAGHAYNPEDDTDPLSEYADEANTVDNMDVNLMMFAISQLCTPEEWGYLYRAYYKEMTISEIATELGVNRKRLYKYRRNILEKVQAFI